MDEKIEYKNDTSTFIFTLLYFNNLAKRSDDEYIYIFFPLLLVLLQYFEVIHVVPIITSSVWFA